MLRALAVVAGGLAILGGALFLFIGGPGIVHGLVWTAVHPRIEWPAGGDRARLEEIGTPASPPVTPLPWELIAPGGRGAVPGTTALLATRRRGTADWVGVSTGADHSGHVLDAGRRPVESFTLAGGGPTAVTGVVMPAPAVLLLIGAERLPDGRFVRTLDEYDFTRKQRTRRLTGELSGYGILFAPLGERAGLVVYGAGELAMGINMPRSRYSTFRLYASDAPAGADLLRLSYGVGSVQALWAERPDRVVFLTRFDHGLAPRSPRDRAWALTLR